jgi:hypothetical protein
MLLSLALGALLTVLVAWTGVLDATLLGCGGPTCGAIERSLDCSERSLTVVSRTRAPGLESIRFMYVGRSMLQGTGDDWSPPFPGGARELLEPHMLDVLNEVVGRSGTRGTGCCPQHCIEARGWPFVALWGARMAGRPIGLAGTSACGRAGPLHAIPVGRDRFLPLRPLWRGFALDILLYALVVWIIMLLRDATRSLPIVPVACVPLLALAVPSVTATGSTLMFSILGCDPNHAGHGHSFGFPLDWMHLSHAWHEADEIWEVKRHAGRLAIDVAVAAGMIAILFALWWWRCRRTVVVLAVGLAVLAATLLVMWHDGAPEGTSWMAGRTGRHPRLAPVLLPLWILLVALTTLGLRHGRQRRGCCPHCDYPLTGLPEPARCPECGYATAPEPQQG